MYPEFGGPPLDRPPIAAPYLGNLVRAAKEYRAYLDKELEPDTDKPKWSGSQRQYLRRLRAKWRVRELGEDAHYQKHGTFRRPMNADPPGPAEFIQETWRRRHEDYTGERVSAAAQRRKERMPTIHDIVKRIQRQNGTKPTKTKED